MDDTLRTGFKLTALEKLASKEKGALRCGPFGSEPLHSEFVEAGIPAIGIQDVQENNFILSGRWHVSPEKAEELKRFRIQPRDLLITVMGTLGCACPVPEQTPHMVSTKHVWIVTLDQHKADERWLSYWLNYARQVREDILGQSTGTAIAGLNGKKIRAVTLPDISIEKQRGIVANLDDLQAKVNVLKRM